MEDLYTDSVTRLLNLLRKQYNDGTIVSFYEGDPIQIPDAAYPAICVSKISAQVNVDATATDLMVEVISVKIIMNKKDDFGAKDDQDLTERKLKLFVEGRATSGQYGDNTVLKLLRTSFTLGTFTVQNKMSINYDALPIGGGRARSQAEISLTLTERIIVPDRT
jgi:hypothetical protein